MASDERTAQLLGQFLQLIHVLADDERRLTAMSANQLLDDAVLARLGGRHPVAHVRLGQSAGHPLAVVECDAYLHAVRRGDVALVLQFLPRRVVAFGADEAEDVVLVTVLPHQGRRQSQPSSRLQICRHAEHRCRQQVHLVVDDESPVAGLEELQVGVHAVPLGRDDLIRCDGDRAHFLAGPGVLADLVGGEGGAPHQLVLPLSGRDGVGHQDERRAASPCHRSSSHDRLASSTGQHDDAGPATEE